VASHAGGPAPGDEVDGELTDDDAEKEERAGERLEGAEEEVEVLRPRAPSRGVEDDLGEEAGAEEGAQEDAEGDSGEAADD
jgi:hypothetical protein